MKATLITEVGLLVDGVVLRRVEPRDILAAQRLDELEHAMRVRQRIRKEDLPPTRRPSPNARTTQVTTPPPSTSGIPEEKEGASCEKLPLSSSMEKHNSQCMVTSTTTRTTVEGSPNAPSHSCHNVQQEKENKKEKEGMRCGGTSLNDEGLTCSMKDEHSPGEATRDADGGEEAAGVMVQEAEDPLFTSQASKSSTRTNAQMRETETKIEDAMTQSEHPQSLPSKSEGVSFGLLSRSSTTPKSSLALLCPPSPPKNPLPFYFSSSPFYASPSFHVCTALQTELFNSKPALRVFSPPLPPSSLFSVPFQGRLPNGRGKRRGGRGVGEDKDDDARPSVFSSPTLFFSSSLHPGSSVLPNLPMSPSRFPSALHAFQTNAATEGWNESSSTPLSHRIPPSSFPLPPPSFPFCSHLAGYSSSVATSSFVVKHAIEEEWELRRRHPLRWCCHYLSHAVFICAAMGPPSSFPVSVVQVQSLLSTTSSEEKGKRKQKKNVKTANGSERKEEEEPVERDVRKGSPRVVLPLSPASLHPSPSSRGSPFSSSFPPAYASSSPLREGGAPPARHHSSSPVPSSAVSSPLCPIADKENAMLGDGTGVEDSGGGGASLTACSTLPGVVAGGEAPDICPPSPRVSSSSLSAASSVSSTQAGRNAVMEVEEVGVIPSLCLPQSHFHFTDILPWGYHSPSEVFSVVGRHTNKGLIVGVMEVEEDGSDDENDHKKQDEERVNENRKGKRKTKKGGEDIQRNGEGQRYSSPALPRSPFSPSSVSSSPHGPSHRPPPPSSSVGSTSSSYSATFSTSLTGASHPTTGGPLRCRAEEERHRPEGRELHSGTTRGALAGDVERDVRDGQETRSTKKGREEEKEAEPQRGVRTNGRGDSSSIPDTTKKRKKVKYLVCPYAAYRRLMGWWWLQEVRQRALWEHRRRYRLQCRMTTTPTDPRPSFRWKNAPSLRWQLLHTAPVMASPLDSIRTSHSHRRPSATRGRPWPCSTEGGGGEVEDDGEDEWERTEEGGEKKTNIKKDPFREESVAGKDTVHTTPRRMLGTPPELAGRPFSSHFSHLLQKSRSLLGGSFTSSSTSSRRSSESSYRSSGVGSSGVQTPFGLPISPVTTHTLAVSSTPPFPSLAVQSSSRTGRERNWMEPRDGATSMFPFSSRDRDHLSQRSPWRERRREEEEGEEGISWWRRRMTREEDDSRTLSSSGESSRSETPMSVWSSQRSSRSSVGSSMMWIKREVEGGPPSTGLHMLQKVRTAWEERVLQIEARKGEEITTGKEMKTRKKTPKKKRRKTMGNQEPTEPPTFSPPLPLLSASPSSSPGSLSSSTTRLSPRHRSTRELGRTLPPFSDVQGEDGGGDGTEEVWRRFPEDEVYHGSTSPLLFPPSGTDTVGPTTTHRVATGSAGVSSCSSSFSSLSSMAPTIVAITRNVADQGHPSILSFSRAGTPSTSVTPVSTGGSASVSFSSSSNSPSSSPIPSTSRVPLLNATGKSLSQDKTHEKDKEKRRRRHGRKNKEDATHASLPLSSSKIPFPPPPPTSPLYLTQDGMSTVDWNTSSPSPRHSHARSPGEHHRFLHSTRETHLPPPVARVGRTSPIPTSAITITPLTSHTLMLPKTSTRTLSIVNPSLYSTLFLSSRSMSTLNYADEPPLSPHAPLREGALSGTVRSSGNTRSVDADATWWKRSPRPDEQGGGEKEGHQRSTSRSTSKGQGVSLSNSRVLLPSPSSSFFLKTAVSPSSFASRSSPSTTNSSTSTLMESLRDARHGEGKVVLPGAGAIGTRGGRAPLRPHESGERPRGRSTALTTAEMVAQTKVKRLSQKKKTKDEGADASTPGMAQEEVERERLLASTTAKDRLPYTSSLLSLSLSASSPFSPVRDTQVVKEAPPETMAGRNGVPAAVSGDKRTMRIKGTRVLASKEVSHLPSSTMEVEATASDLREHHHHHHGKKHKRYSITATTETVNLPPTLLLKDGRDSAAGMNRRWRHGEETTEMALPMNESRKGGATQERLHPMEDHDDADDGTASITLHPRTPLSFSSLPSPPSPCRLSSSSSPRFHYYTAWCKRIEVQAVTNMKDEEKEEGGPSSSDGCFIPSLPSTRAEEYTRYYEYCFEGGCGREERTQQMEMWKRRSRLSRTAAGVQATAGDSEEEDADRAEEKDDASDKTTASTTVQNRGQGHDPHASPGKAAKLADGATEEEKKPSKQEEEKPIKETKSPTKIPYPTLHNIGNEKAEQEEEDTTDVFCLPPPPPLPPRLPPPLLIEQQPFTLQYWPYPSAPQRCSGVNPTNTTSHPGKMTVEKTVSQEMTETGEIKGPNQSRARRDGLPSFFSSPTSFPSPPPAAPLYASSLSFSPPLPLSLTTSSMCCAPLGFRASRTGTGGRGAFLEEDSTTASSTTLLGPTSPPPPPPVPMWFYRQAFFFLAAVLKDKLQADAKRARRRQQRKERKKNRSPSPLSIRDGRPHSKQAGSRSGGRLSSHTTAVPRRSCIHSSQEWDISGNATQKGETLEDSSKSSSSSASGSSTSSSAVSKSKSFSTSVLPPPPSLGGSAHVCCDGPDEGREEESTRSAPRTPPKDQKKPPFPKKRTHGQKRKRKAAKSERHAVVASQDSPLHDTTALRSPLPPPPSSFPLVRTSSTELYHSYPSSGITRLPDDNPSREGGGLARVSSNVPNLTTTTTTAMGSSVVTVQRWESSAVVQYGKSSTTTTTMRSSGTSGEERWSNSLTSRGQRSLTPRSAGLSSPTPPFPFSTASLPRPLLSSTTTSVAVAARKYLSKHHAEGPPVLPPNSMAFSWWSVESALCEEKRRRQEERQKKIKRKKKGDEQKRTRPRGITWTPPAAAVPLVERLSGRPRGSGEHADERDTPQAREETRRCATEGESLTEGRVTPTKSSPGAAPSPPSPRLSQERVPILLGNTSQMGANRRTVPPGDTAPPRKELTGGASPSSSPFSSASSSFSFLSMEPPPTTAGHSRRRGGYGISSTRRTKTEDAKEKENAAKAAALCSAAAAFEAAERSAAKASGRGKGGRNPKEVRQTNKDGCGALTRTLTGTQRAAKTLLEDPKQQKEGENTAADSDGSSVPPTATTTRLEDKQSHTNEPDDARGATRTSPEEEEDTELELAGCKEGVVVVMQTNEHKKRNGSTPKPFLVVPRSVSTSSVGGPAFPSFPPTPSPPLFCTPLSPGLGSPTRTTPPTSPASPPSPSSFTRSLPLASSVWGDISGVLHRDRGYGEGRSGHPHGLPEPPPRCSPLRTGMSGATTSMTSTVPHASPRPEEVARGVGETLRHRPRQRRRQDRKRSATIVEGAEGATSLFSEGDEERGRGGVEPLSTALSVWFPSCSSRGGTNGPEGFGSFSPSGRSDRRGAPRAGGMRRRMTGEQRGDAGEVANDDEEEEEEDEEPEERKPSEGQPNLTLWFTSSLFTQDAKRQHTTRRTQPPEERRRRAGDVRRDIKKKTKKKDFPVAFPLPFSFLSSVRAGVLPSSSRFLEMGTRESERASKRETFLPSTSRAEKTPPANSSPFFSLSSVFRSYWWMAEAWRNECLEEWDLEDLQLAPTLGLHVPSAPCPVHTRVLARRFGGGIEPAEVIRVHPDYSYTLRYFPDNTMSTTPATTTMGTNTINPLKEGAEKRPSAEENDGDEVRVPARRRSGSALSLDPSRRPRALSPYFGTRRREASGKGKGGEWEKDREKGKPSEEWTSRSRHDGTSGSVSGSSCRFQYCHQHLASGRHCLCQCTGPGRHLDEVDVGVLHRDIHILQEGEVLAMHRLPMTGTASTTDSAPRRRRTGSNMGSSSPWNVENEDIEEDDDEEEEEEEGRWIRLHATAGAEWEKKNKKGKEESDATAQGTSVTTHPSSAVGTDDVGFLPMRSFSFYYYDTDILPNPWEQRRVSRVTEPSSMSGRGRTASLSRTRRTITEATLPSSPPLLHHHGQRGSGSRDHRLSTHGALPMETPLLTQEGIINEKPRGRGFTLLPSRDSGSFSSKRRSSSRSSLLHGNVAGASSSSSSAALAFPLSSCYSYYYAEDAVGDGYRLAPPLLPPPKSSSWSSSFFFRYFAPSRARPPRVLHVQEPLVGCGYGILTSTTMKKMMQDEQQKAAVAITTLAGSHSELSTASSPSGLPPAPPPSLVSTSQVGKPSSPPHGTRVESVVWNASSNDPPPPPESTDGVLRTTTTADGWTLQNTLGLSLSASSSPPPLPLPLPLSIVPKGPPRGYPAREGRVSLKTIEAALYRSTLTTNRSADKPYAGITASTTRLPFASGLTDEEDLTSVFFGGGGGGGGFSQKGTVLAAPAVTPFTCSSYLSLPRRDGTSISTSSVAPLAWRPSTMVSSLVTTTSAARAPLEATSSHVAPLTSATSPVGGGGGGTPGRGKEVSRVPRTESCSVGDYVVLMAVTLRRGVIVEALGGERYTVLLFHNPHEEGEYDQAEDRQAPDVVMATPGERCGGNLAKTTSPAREDVHGSTLERESEGEDEDEEEEEEGKEGKRSRASKSRQRRRREKKKRKSHRRILSPTTHEQSTTSSASTLFHLPQLATTSASSSVLGIQRKGHGGMGEGGGAPLTVAPVVPSLEGIIGLPMGPLESFFSFTYDMAHLFQSSHHLQEAYCFTRSTSTYTGSLHGVAGCFYGHPPFSSFTVTSYVEEKTPLDRKALLLSSGEGEAGGQTSTADPFRTSAGGRGGSVSEDRKSTAKYSSSTSFSPVSSPPFSSSSMYYTFGRSPSAKVRWQLVLQTLIADAAVHRLRPPHETSVDGRRVEAGMGMPPWTSSLSSSSPARRSSSLSPAVPLPFSSPTLPLGSSPSFSLMSSSLPPSCCPHPSSSSWFDRREAAMSSVLSLSPLATPMAALNGKEWWRGASSQPSSSCSSSSCCLPFGSSAGRTCNCYPCHDPSLDKAGDTPEEDVEDDEEAAGEEEDLLRILTAFTPFTMVTVSSAEFIRVTRREYLYGGLYANPLHVRWFQSLDPDCTGRVRWEKVKRLVFQVLQLGAFEQEFYGDHICATGEKKGPGRTAVTSTSEKGISSFGGVPASHSATPYSLSTSIVADKLKELQSFLLYWRSIRKETGEVKVEEQSHREMSKSMSNDSLGRSVSTVATALTGNRENTINTANVVLPPSHNADPMKKRSAGRFLNPRKMHFTEENKLLVNFEEFHYVILAIRNMI